MKKLWYLCCLLLLLINSSLAQQTKITGTLKDSDGKPIESATVQVKGKTTGTLTNANGEFTINARVGDKLIIKAIGFKDQEVEATGSGLNIKLDAQAGDAGEVVVVGYTTQ